MPGAEEPSALEENENEESQDPRLRLLGSFVARSLRPAAGAWERCAGTAEVGQLLQAFLDHSATTEPRPLLVVQPGPGGLAVRPCLDAGPETGPARAKGLFFLRTRPEPPGSHSLRGAVLCGDLPALPLEHLAPLLSEVIIPVLANEKNHLDWPHMVCQDVRRHAHSLQCDLLVILEQVKGRTLLPLPAGSENMEFVGGDGELVLDSIDKSTVYAIESAVIRWSHQVQVVLKRESSQPLLQGGNPTPKVELEFWKSRCEDLEHIYNQLMTIKVRGMAGLLDRLQSSYLPAFKAMFRDVEAALTEAQDIHVHLLPLQRHLDILESTEFPEVKGRLRPLLHVVCLIWATCEWYCSPGRLTVLLQEICNLLIQQASNYLSPEDLLRSEVEESQRKLRVVSDTLSFFKRAFQDRREHLHTYFKGDSQVRGWDFQASLVFARLDGFLGQLCTVEGLLKTALDFNKLEKLEFSGIRGNTLSQQVQQMHKEFEEMYKVFLECSYDCLDPQGMEFENDVCEFNKRVEDLDRRLGTVLIHALDDAPDVEHAFKLLDIAGLLLERPLIAQVVSHKYLSLIRLFSAELDAVRAIYSQRIQEEAEHGFSPVHKNMPAMAGGIRWAQELRQRIKSPFSNFTHIPYPCLQSAEGKRMVQKYEDLLSLLEEYERRLYEEWCQTVSEKSQYNLSLPLLHRDPNTKQLSVNFNPQLTSVLKEMSYLQPTEVKPVPETAAAIFSSREFYRQLVANLELMASWYNKVIKTLLEVEFPLVEGELLNIDLRLRAAEETLSWKTEGIWDYAMQITNSIHDLEQRIQKTKDNVEEIQSIMKTWVSPIFKRKDGKKECPLSLDDQQDRMEKYYTLIRESGLKIHTLIQENQVLFASDPESSIWKTYVNYIDSMLLDGFFHAIECSLKYLLENTECKPGLTPIFEAQLNLVTPELVFHPSLDSGVKGGLYDIVQNLVSSIFAVASLVPRLSPHSGSPHYQGDLEDMADLASLRSVLMERVQSMMSLCCGYRNTLSQYSYLYVEDRREALGQFLLYGHVLTPEEIEAHAEDGIPESPPLLHHFKVQIDSYEKLYEEVVSLEPTKVFDGWMRVDLRPFKASLLNTVKKWSLMFKQHLVDFVTNRFNSTDPHQMLDAWHSEIQRMESTMATISKSAALFEVSVPEFKQLRQCRKEACQLKELWDTIGMVTSSIHAWEATSWRSISVEAMDSECKQFSRHIRNLDKELRAWDAFTGLESTVLNTLTSLRAVAELQNPAIRERHWRQLMQATGVSFTMDQDTTLAHLLQLQLHHFEDEVRGIVDRAVKEMGMEKTLKELQTTWASMQFHYEPHARTHIPLLQSDEDLIEVLEDNQLQLQNLMMSKYISFFLEEVSTWQRKLSTADSVISIWFEVQRTWSHLESIFIGSEDIRAQLPQVQRHLSKLFDNIAKMQLQLDATQNPTKTSLGMYSKEEEYVAFSEPCDCSGPVEIWLNHVLRHMKATVRHEMTEAVTAYEEKPREQWLFDYPAQVALTCTQIWWTTEVGIAFARLEEGYEHAMKDYYKKQVAQLKTLITMLIGQLSKGDRQKIMTICTIDVHARDVVAKMIAQKVDNAQAFLWLSQLRHRWDDEAKHCFANICDAQFLYSYEYLGNTPRLVITPLTDRCYITLTQSLHLTMSGAPAGPAGTGKTETTKDLGRALGIMVYVFNCSEQMDYKSCGNIYKGLAQTGAWGCFDEFNRISVEVLSVVAVQVKSIQDAIRDRKQRFSFLGEEISLDPSVGIFITMNPGYAGRTELPENLKALFRPCAMVVPDFELICEIMLVAEGFIEAQSLGQKFLTLWPLCAVFHQDHYDWGLRAIKSVLVVAGSLKRGDPDRPEDQVLMRSLRDFNIPKIVTDDMPVFMGLIGDLFPALDVPRRRDLNFEAVVRKAILELKLQAEDNFVLKVIQLEELLAVRHSVFVVGDAGTGKSQVLRSLHKTYQLMRRRPVWTDLNPKAVTNDELFGIINPATREWKDGLFSSVMRDLANISHDGPKWILLDGDIDPMWIESLNTVMDDNKVLTLASNERIPLNPTMRLLFEISHLRTATPATVSRAGILYISPADLGWNPPVSSWIDQREVQTERANLTILFDKYLPTCLDTLRTRFKKIIPVPEQSMIQLLCYLLESLLTKEDIPADCPKEMYELYFVFAAIWAFGSAMVQDQLVDYRAEFSKWWLTEFKTIKFPSQGTVFDYYIDPETKKFEPWAKLIPQFEFDPEMPLQACLVHTSETIRLCYFMERLMERRRPVMLVGPAGSGKSVLVGAKLASLDSEQYMVKNVPFNYYTTSAMLQAVLEKPLEKKAGRNYGPPGNRRLIYFIDDMNMPEVDAYGTVQPHTVIRQHLDYGHWYDRNKLSLKEIMNVQYISCMNPTAGSFTINPRLQRHFSVFVLSFPGADALSSIYSTILTHHLKLGNFPNTLQKSVPPLINMAVTFHQKIATTFLPTAIKFHYIFNLRDFANIFQGILFSSAECVKSTQDLGKLYVHESNRVYRDKMVEEKDFNLFDKIQTDFLKKNFGDVEEMLQQTRSLNMYCHFANGIGEPKYMPVRSWELLSQTLVEALESHNEVNAVMDLVLFEDAMCHVCHINRILESPRGNALLVGVGGSGKQSLTRLAAFISSMDVFQITLRKGYQTPDFKVDLASLCLKAGVKNLSTVFLMTDTHVADERFLVLINDLLASGEVPGLYSDDEVESIISNVRNEVKSQGLVDSRENCWKFFIDRVRRQLKVTLCFSPVGNKLRVRSRKFPAIVNCTAINWFHKWPQEALESVSLRFLQNTKNIEPAVKQSISKFMAFVHTSVNKTSQLYLLNEQRYNYTTPKSFLEFIRLYRSLLDRNGRELQSKVERLESGLLKLHSTSAQVDGLKAKLATQEVELRQKNEDADKLIQVVGVETAKVSREKAIADEEEQKVALIMLEVQQKQKDCEEDLAKAEPALAAAQAALNTLNKTNLTELKSFGSPPLAVSNVSAAVMVLMAPGGKVPKDRSWKAAKITMAKVDSFLDSLIHFDKENIHENCLKAIRPYLQDPTFNPEFVATKSYAAAGLCSWVMNIVKFYEVFCDVEPKRQALNKATSDLTAAQEKLAAIKAKITRLNENLAKLTAKFEKATAEKLKCQQEAEETTGTISLANRLVGGLASENIRWAEAVQNFKQQERTLCGDILLTTAFISYLGFFTKKYRKSLMDGTWKPYLSQLKVPIPTTPTLDPLRMLTDDADVATWQNQGLPADRMSVENATILTSCERWPLMVDPQLQGIKWIKNKYGEELRVTQLGQKGCLHTIERALEAGEVVLIENLEETIDPVLGPLLGREVIKKGRFIKIGDKECEFNPKFRLILHTKLANPHYQPELQAQATLINFTVTRDGLEDQLLAAVVCMERPDLEQLKSDLTKQQNGFKITLKTLEDNLLSRLSSASGNFLGETALVENLEITKKTAAEVDDKVQEAKLTEVKINEAREHYRPAAARASLLYFILNDLSKIHPMYQFSLKAFNIVFQKAVEKAAPSESVKERVANLIDSVTFSVYQYTTRGLFECDKLTYLAQLTFQILFENQEVSAAELDFLLRTPVQTGTPSPLEFLSHQAWGGIKALSSMEEFCNLDRDIEGSAKSWKKFMESECPEKEKFPQEWKNKTALQRLCMMRVMRPDRMTYAMRDFVEEKLGSKYVMGRALDFVASFEESGPATPMFFILSPGVDPLKDVENQGKKLGYTFNNRNFHNVSLGQGQEVVAEAALDLAAKKGHWVILQNIHLVAKWLSTLEKKLEELSEESHPDFRVFISAEPAPSPEGHIIPQGILENSIKITNEPPTGMHANLHKALDNFTQDTLEMCSRETEFKSILFALCYFHAVVAERRKFGPQGWNRSYPFNTGDLTISVNVLYNFLESNVKVPYDDLRYLFGEIMYGGHITDDWDRRLCRTYLEEFIRPEMLEGELSLAPGFPLPGNMDYSGYHQYIDAELPPESPYLYGLHPNAEIGFLTLTSEKLFRTVLEMQPRDSHAGDGATITREEKVCGGYGLRKFGKPKASLQARRQRAKAQACPFSHTLETLNQAYQHVPASGELTMTSEMENLQNALYLDVVPEPWARRAYPSTAGLAAWFLDLLNRIKELEVWTGDFAMPSTVWLTGFFNPQSFLTAIMQSMARKNEWPLDQMALQCDVTKKSREEFRSPPREGAYIHGLFMEGACWDTQAGIITEAKLKDLTPPMPVMFLKAIPADKQDCRSVYACPVYKTCQRGPTFVWTFNLKTKENPSKWVLAGVALLLQI
nr:dynein heavy chain 9, axonemal [Meriones unguiculatus]